MRRIRNVSFVVLCVCLFQIRGFADACTAPGLVGLGSTQAEALEACDSDGQTRCSGLCQTGCTTDAWTQPPVCNATYQGGSGWTAAGHCKCGTGM